MIERAASVGVFVRDQDRALEFYIAKLGFEVRSDEQVGPSARRVEVAPRGAQTGLSLSEPTSAGHRVGVFTHVVFECEDVWYAHERLSRAGVEFDVEPLRQSWGWWAQFRDLDGNQFVLVEKRR